MWVTVVREVFGRQQSRTGVFRGRMLGRGGREAASLRSSTLAVRSSTFFLVLRVGADVPTVPIEWRVPAEALDAKVSPELLMVEASSWALSKTWMSS